MEKSQLPLWRKIFSQMIFLTHLFCIVFLVTGSFWPKPFLLFHLIATPLVILQWTLNKNQCLLTQWQHRLEGRQLPQEQDGQFVRELFSKIGLQPSDQILKYVIYAPLFINWVLAFYRYFFEHSNL